MIRILVVEDNNAKQDNIKSTILDVGNIKEDDLIIVNCVKEAKKLLYENYFDLMILDLVLPVEVDDDAEAKNGIAFLETIHNSPYIKPPIYIIGLSSHSDEVTKFREQFTKRLWHLIEYQADSEAWKDQLTNVIYHLVKTREQFIKQSLKQNLFDIAIITALPVPELDAVLKLNAGQWEKFKVQGDVTQYYKTVFTKDGKSKTIVAATADQMGMTASAHLTTKMILYFKPQYIISAGIAAGLKERDLGFGDILIAEQSWDYGSGKIVEVAKDGNDVIADVAFQPDTRDIQLSADLKAKVTAFKMSNTKVLDSIQNDWPGDKPATKLQMHLGQIGSGSYVISSEEKLKSIKDSHRKLLGVEMETYGVYYSAEHSSEPQTKAISMKSVSDYGDGTKNDKYQKYAAYTSATLVYHFILNEL